MSTVSAGPSIVVTEAQRRQFREDGYFMTDVVFDEATLAGVRAQFKRFWDEAIVAAQKTGNTFEIERAKARPFIAQLDRKSDVCQAFIKHRVFQDLALQLIGPDVDVTWNQCIIKAPQDPKSADTFFSWHQDQWYALNGSYKDDCNMEVLTEPDNAITCWVAISRTIVDNGTLWVLPGRHKEGLLPHVWSKERNEWEGQYDTSWKIPAVLRAGQVLVFKKYLPHSSGQNISQETRMAYQIGYVAKGLKKGPSPDLSPLLRNGVEA